jgi:hypothetical protein
VSETFLILRRIEGDMIKMNIGLHIKNTLFLSGFNQTGIFWTYCFKNTQVRPPVAAELFQVDMKTDITKLIVDFRNVANAPKNCSQL